MEGKRRVPPSMDRRDRIFVVLAFLQLRWKQIPKIFCNDTMSAEGKSQVHNFDPKEWDPVFSEICRFKGDEECEEDEEGEEGEEGDLVEEGGGILCHLRNHEDPVSAPATEETANFCGNVNLDDLEGRVGTAGNKFAAWMDDRNRSGKVRKHPDRLAATDLYQLLSDQVSHKIYSG